MSVFVSTTIKYFSIGCQYIFSHMSYRELDMHIIDIWSRDKGMLGTVCKTFWSQKSRDYFIICCTARFLTSAVQRDELYLNLLMSNREKESICMPKVIACVSLSISSFSIWIALFWRFISWEEMWGEFGGKSQEILTKK
jgi:hypothetical protein